MTTSQLQARMVNTLLNINIAARYLFEGFGLGWVDTLNWGAVWNKDLKIKQYTSLKK